MTRWKFRARMLMLTLAAGLFPHASRAQQAELRATPSEPEPGSFIRLTLNVPADDSVRAIRGTMAGEPLHFMAGAHGTWHALGAVPVDASGRVMAHAVVDLASGGVDSLRAVVAVPKLEVPKAVPLAVDSGFTKPLDAATQARIARENARARAIGRHSHDTPRLWTAPFLRPRDSHVTSGFGTGRVFNGHLTSRHLGVDFRGTTGEPVRAANRGVVVLVDNFFLAGNVIYVDHGAGVVTGYFHLSKPLVSVGDTVMRGERIGLVGATGRVTASHLHWNARYGGLTLNPLTLLDIPVSWFPAGTTARKR